MSQPAFPSPGAQLKAGISGRIEAFEVTPGMTLAQYYAGQALAGLCAREASTTVYGQEEILTNKAKRLGEDLAAKMEHIR